MRLFLFSALAASFLLVPFFGDAQLYATGAGWAFAFAAALNLAIDIYRGRREALRRRPLHRVNGQRFDPVTKRW
jgi:hypothetical protein